jgi:hypothetical protein
MAADDDPDRRCYAAAFEKFRNEMVKQHREFMWRAGQQPKGPPPVDDMKIINGTVKVL